MKLRTKNQINLKPIFQFKSVLCFSNISVLLFSLPTEKRLIFMELMTNPYGLFREVAQ